MAKRKKTKRAKAACGGRAKAQKGGRADTQALMGKAGMPGAASGPSLADILNQLRVSGRGAIVDLLGVPLGVGAEGDPRALAQHETTSRLGTEKLIDFGLRPEFAGGVVEGLGNINEVLAGLTSVLGGGKFFSPAGLDIADLQANVKGIDKAKAKAQTPSRPSTIRGAKGGRVKAQSGGLSRAGVMPSFNPISTGTPTPGLPMPGLLPHQLPGQPAGPFPIGGQQTVGEQSGSSNMTTQQSAPTGNLDNIVQQLLRFRAGGGQDVNNLRNFNPLTGELGATQNELLTTGLPTDVAGATEAARIRAGQEFDSASDSINELLASKGLLSSSARTAAIARERAKMGERIGATGLEAEIAANEAAAGRRAGAVNQGAQFTGQQLAGLQGAGSLELGRSGQNLGAMTGAASGAATSAGLNQKTTQSGSTSGRTEGAGTRFSFMPPPNVGGPAPSAGGGGLGGGGRAPIGSTPFSPINVIHSNQNPANPGFVGNQGSRSLFGASGGRAPDLKGFEQWLEQIGRKVHEAFGPSVAPITDPSEKRRVSIDVALRNLGGPEEALRLFSDPELQTAAKREGHRHLAAVRNTPQMMASGDPRVTALISGFHNLKTLGKGTRINLDPSASDFVQVTPTNPPQPQEQPNQQDRSMLDVLGVQGSAINRQSFQGGGPVRAVPNHEPTANMADMGMAMPTAVDNRRQFFEGGGEVPGQDTGQDQVPAMLRSEELVVTPELVEAIEAVDSPDAAMAVVQALKQLAQKPLEFDPEIGEHVAQGGGLTPEEMAIPFTVGSQPAFSPQLMQMGAQNQEFAGPNVIDNILQALSRLGQLNTLPVGAPTEGEGIGLGPAGQAIQDRPQELLETATGTKKQFFDKKKAGEEVEGPPAPTPLQLAMGQPIPLEVLRDPNFMPFAGPPKQGTAEVVPGVGMPDTLRVEGGTRDPFTGEQIQPTRFKGNMQGTVSTLGTAPLTEEQQQMKRIEDAKNRRSLIQSAMLTDPVGGPEKFARLQNALNNSDREVETLVNEVVAREQNRIRERQAAANEVFAQANLENATAQKLQAESQKATAHANVALKLREFAAKDPRAAMIIEMFSKMGPQGERGAEMAEAMMKRILAGWGLEITENGFFRQLFGAPEFEFGISPTALQEDLSPETIELLAATMPEVLGQ